MSFLEKSVIEKRALHMGEMGQFSEMITHLQAQDR